MDIAEAVCSDIGIVTLSGRLAQGLQEYSLSETKTVSRTLLEHGNLGHSLVVNNGIWLHWSVEMVASLAETGCCLRFMHVTV